jgi:hypothetical protein
MIDPLQEFSYREGNYERPNREWECGWAAQGESCHIGPDGAGICQAHRECIPYKDGDRYNCARPINFGNKCELGPRPDGSCSQRVVECQPVRTLRQKRKLFTFTVAVLALGCCLIMFGGSWDNSLISPGELTSQHHINERKCSECHTAANSSFAQWVGIAINPKPTPGDSQLCLKCHKEFGSQPLMAHGMDVEHLKSLHAGRPDVTKPGKQPFVYALLKKVARNPLDDKNGLACALCHHEHRGQNFDLTHMSNIQCQNCHSAQFHSFADGHPEFTGFPYERRTRLYFDHVTHYQVHFKSFERVKPGAVLPAELRDYGDGANPSAQSCKACHQPDSSGRMMPIRSFEHSYAACHGAEIEEDAFPGVQLLAIPMLDSELLTTDGAAIGQWPLLKAGDGPGAKSHDLSVLPLMEILLSADDNCLKARKDFLKVRKEIQRGSENLDELNEQQAEAMQSMAWGIKRLIHKLGTESHATNENRLNHLNKKFTADGDAELLKTLSASLFRDPTFVIALETAQQNWFPDLGEEIEGLNEGAPPAYSLVDVEPPSTRDDPPSGWYTILSDGTLRYRVTGHSDRLMRAVLDLAGRVPHLRGAAAEKDTPQPSPFGALGPTASFRCLGCHTADKQDDGRLVINWVGRHVSPDTQSFTRFSHAPHLTLQLAKDDCTKCHSIQENINFAREEFVRFREMFTANTNPHSALTSGFVPVAKATCAKYHTSRLAGDSCLKCHNYHIFN